MKDLIEREAALSCFHCWADKYGDVHEPDEMAEYRDIEALPSAQPEIIYCKECSRYSNGYCHHPETYGMYVDANHFCGYAERMGDE